MNAYTQLSLAATRFALILMFAVALTVPDTNAQNSVAPSAVGAAQQDAQLWRRAARIHRSAILVDGHNDITTPMVNKDYDLATPSAGTYHTDINRMKQGGVTAEFFAIYIDSDFVKTGGSARRALDMIDRVYAAAERRPESLVMATTADGIRRAKRQNKIAALMGIEGGHAIENSLGALREFHRLGVRYMTLTHNNTNDWADSCCDKPRHDGLSDFGKEVVREMNRLGMLVDISHVSDATMNDVLDLSRAPIIASHSSARSLNNHPRNVPDDVLRRIATNGGVVMVNFYPAFIDQKVYDASRARTARLKPQTDALREQYKDDPARLEAEIDKLNAANPLPATTLSVLVDHIDHIRKVAGIDHVGIGSDFDGVPSLPEGLEDISRMPNITYELLRRGYSDEDVRKVLGGNFLRAFARAEQVAREQGSTISGEGSTKKIK